ncbi:hypothetical protein lerEdw1_017234 [Lerista edwardsae]|nr:hypothetical protein lerEdw1_017234 [Lerista edwardsae]
MIKSLAWLLVLVLESSLQDTAGRTPLQGFRYVSYEVIIPRKLMSRYGQEPADLTYLLPFEEKGHMVHLRQSMSFVPKHLPVFTYNEMGGVQEDHPFIRGDCYYHGFVQEKPTSSISLNTCSGGLRGMLSFDKKVYEIQPVQSSATFQHVIYQLEAKEDELHTRCGLTEEEQIRQDAMILKRKPVAGTPNKLGGHQGTPNRPVNIAIVVEHEQYVQFGNNESLTLTRVMDVVQMANALYKSLGVQLNLVGLEIWSQNNLIVIGDNIEDVLDNFNSWRLNALVKRLENDASHLFVYKSFGHKEGLAFKGTLCDNHWASAVESYMTSSLVLFANLFAHELGHILGMQHDGKNCTCNRHACIMAAVPAIADQFSSCSSDSYFKFRNSGCMLVPLEPKVMDIPRACGNKVMEQGEQCDCGSEMECLADLCCQSNCKLRSDATCASGKCCGGCKYLPAGTVCRENTSVCDLPEYCNGTSQWCPQDFYVYDGAPCKDGAYCYHGHCSTHHEQCREIFGKKATAASRDCFREVNAQGDRFGNCGLRNGSYDKCHADSILCGRIQCVNVDELPSSDELRVIIQTSIGETKCWSAHHLSGMNLTDIGAVRDGTPCGNDRMCVNGKCVQVFNLLKYGCNVTKFHNRGICNNRKHFHCNYGWAPPDCLEKGYGGSIDSGPPSPRTTGSRVGRIVGMVLGISFAALFLALLVGQRHGLIRRLNSAAHGLGIYYRNNIRKRFIAERFQPTTLIPKESQDEITDMDKE